jgi:hypothetical protein
MTNSDYVKRAAEARAAGGLQGKLQSEKFILSQISYHKSGAEFYDQLGETAMAKWSRETAEVWKNKLAALKAEGTTGEGSVQ